MSTEIIINCHTPKEGELLEIKAETSLTITS
jgi:hypothetical protein